jgi:hypothetical protein
VIVGGDCGLDVVRVIWDMGAKAVRSLAEGGTRVAYLQ